MKILLLFSCALLLQGDFCIAKEKKVEPHRDDSWKLVWSDEFDKEGVPDPEKWGYEIGFVRNNEDQWYQRDNARCEKGLLVIEAKKESKKIPKTNHPRWILRRYGKDKIEYTSASLITKRKLTWTYGRFEMMARLPTGAGLWPAWWTTGKGHWPYGGEIDMMEYYDHSILANFAWAGKGGKVKWDNSKTPLKDFGDSDWSNKFHHCVMEWTPKSIKVWLDGRLLNEVNLSNTKNEYGPDKNPFHHPQRMRLNLALGGINGGNVQKAALPARFEIDWVRVYQKKKE